MSEKRETYFESCSCPHCRNSLDTVSTNTSTCPLCNHTLDPREVWMTRRYPGILVLPGWLKAFGWPLLLILAGFGLIGVSFVTGIPIPIKLPAAILAFGIVYFIYKLSTNGEDP